MTQSKKDSIVLALIILMLLALIIGVCSSISACNKVNPTQDTIYQGHPYGWDLLADGCTVLDFNSIYFVDTADMVIYYDNYDQFDVDHEYELNPDNVTEDLTLKIHISENNLIELFNRMLQWLGVKEESLDDSYYIEYMFGIKRINNELWVLYLGKQ